METDSPPLTLALAQDHELVQAGLARMLEPYADRVRLLHWGERADVTLVDPQAEPRSATLAQAIADPERPRVVVFTWDLEPGSVSQAIGRGAAGYLAKSLGAGELVDALEAIHAGRVVVAGVRGQWADDGRNAALSRLTPRELQVLTHITSGRSNEEIAALLYVSINSVKSYIRSAYRKIGVGSRSRAVLWGLEHGLFLDGDAEEEAPA